MNDIKITDPTTWYMPFTRDAATYNPFDFDQFSSSFSYSDTENALMPVRYGAFLSNPVAPYSRSNFIPTIERPIIIITNPAAGGGKGMRHATRFMSAITGQKYARIEGDIQFLMTHKNPAARVGEIVDTIKKYNPSKPPFILVFGGDGTVADVTEAVSRSARSGYEATIVPCTGGTAGDMRRELGVPKKPAQIIKFLANSKSAELDVITASINGGPKRLVIHSQGNGASGSFFLEVEEYRRLTGRSGMPTYIKAMLKAMPRTEVFYVSVNGGTPMAAGEVITVNSTSLGGIGRIPLPPHGGRLHVLPVNPKLPGPLKPLPGIVTVFDTFGRGAAFNLGNESVISPGSRLRFLGSSRVFDILPGERTTLEFFDAKGKPRAVNSVLNGDPSAGTRKVVLEGSHDRISVLASNDSGHRIRRGEVNYKTMRGMARNGFVTSSGWFKKTLPIKLFGAYEIYKDVADITPENRVALDTGMLAGIFSADIYNVWRFGTTPLMAELPLIVPAFTLGSTSVEMAVDELGKHTGIDELRAGETTNKVAGIGGGFAATYGFMRLVGIEAWNAATASINTAMVKYVGGAGMAVENALLGAVRFLGTISTISFPFLIMPVIDPSELDPLNSTHFPKTA
jgi:diacylglycerol kinase family enzyme